MNCPKCGHDVDRHLHLFPCNGSADCSCMLSQHDVRVAAWQAEAMAARVLIDHHENSSDNSLVFQEKRWEYLKAYEAARVRPSAETNPYA